MSNAKKHDWECEWIIFLEKYVFILKLIRLCHYCSLFTTQGYEQNIKSRHFTNHLSVTHHIACYEKTLSQGHHF